MLRPLPSAINDALDTLHEPNASVPRICYSHVLFRALAVVATHVLVACQPDRDAEIAVISLRAKPHEARQLRQLFSINHTQGHFIAILNCSIVAGLDPVWEHQRMEAVTSCRDSICEDPARRSEVIVYDKGCALRRYRLNFPDGSWPGTRHFFDR